MLKNLIKASFRKFGYEFHKISSQSGAWPAGSADGQSDKDFTRLWNEYHNHQTLKLHFGCGPRVIKGWVNIDLSYEPYENYLKSYGEKYYPQEIRGNRSDLYAFDVTKQGLPLPDNSVDVVFHEDFLEHLSQRNQVVFLAETLRTLKKGGVHRVNSPDLRSSMQDHSDFTKGLAGVYVGEWDKWHHLSILTPTLLREMALMVGYSAVNFNTRDQSIVKDCLPLEYRPASDRPESGNIFADLIK